MQVREPRMAENRASAVIDSSGKFLLLRGQGKFFLHWCLVRKIEFSPLSLCSAIESYYFIFSSTLSLQLLQLEGFLYTNSSTTERSSSSRTSLPFTHAENDKQESKP